MAEEYSKYKLYRKYKTEDGVNYTPLDEYQALSDGSTNNCDCGYRLTEYMVSNPLETECGIELNKNNIFEIISTSGNWTREGNTFTSNDINDNETTVQRIYFNTNTGGITFTIDQSSESGYDYLIIGNLDKTVTNTTSTGSSYNFYNHQGKTTGTTSMTINDTDEHFIELMYKKDDTKSEHRDNVIVTIENFAYNDTTKYEKWYELEYCPYDEQYDNKTGNYEWRVNTSNDCECGYREYEWRVSDPAEYICGYVLNENETPTSPKYIVLSQDTDRSIPMQTFRINATDPGTSGYYFITFSTSPNYYGSIASITGYSICPDEGTIYDNYNKKYITAQTEISDNIYEYTFSVPVYFAGGEANAPLSQVSGYTNTVSSSYNDTTKYEKWYEWEYCPDDEQYNKKTGDYEWRVNISNDCECGYREYEWRFSGEEYICGSDVDGLEPYYKYEVWREYAYCPTDEVIEYEPTGNIDYRNQILIGQNWVMTTQSKLGSELGEEYEQDKRYVLYESHSLCNDKIIETEWRESNLVFKTEIEEKYIKYEASETFIPMGSTVGDIIAIIPNSQYCCESTASGCRQYCYNLFTIYQIDKYGKMEEIYSGRMNNREITLTDNENYSYSLTYGDYCHSGRKAYFTYTLKDEDYHYYMCQVEYQKYDYEDDTKWVEISYRPLYPSNKELTE